MLSTFKIGGTHPQKYKLASHCPISSIPLPEFVHIPLKQHASTPAKAIVTPGDKVKVGTLLAAADGIVSAPIHSSVSGEVVAIGEKIDEFGYVVPMISIKVEGDEYEDGIDLSPEIVKDINYSTEEIIAKIRNAGIVGMGGAGYPTPIKLNIPEGKKAECLIINGIECEPFLCADDRLMQEKAEEIIIGTKIMNKVLGIQNAIIAIDENKKEAIEKISNLTRRYVGVNVRVCKTKYPQGSEKQLIQAITGKEVPIAKLPIDVGCIVQNVGTVFAVYEAVMKNKPLYERILTVSGNNLSQQHNLRVRIGTPASFILEQTHNNPEDASEIIFGGPMMGKSISNIDAPVTKLTSGILLFSFNQKFALKEPASSCIRCGKCVEVCPQGLMPLEIGRHARNNDFSQIFRLHARDCIECGSCAYICPAHIPLLDYCKVSKEEAKKILKKKLG